MMTAVFLGVAALVLGVVVGWVVASARKSAEWQRLTAEKETATQSVTQRALAERDLARSEREKVEAATAELQRRLETAQQARVAAETKLTEAERLLEEKNRFIEESKTQLENSFAALAQKALANVSDQLVQLGKAQLDGSKGEIVQSLDTKKAEIETLLAPLRQMVESYRAELVSSEQARNTVYGGLQEQIRALLTAQESAQREASRLANALQSPTVRGSWGESSLRRCVELAGMSEFCDFTLQETFESEEGRRLRPDLIVKLPNERVIAVDSKVPLMDYALAANEPDDTKRRDLLAAHSKTVRRHIDALSRREYQASIGETLDFVVLFMPGEHFLSAALVTDAALFEYAVERKIYLASPTVLLPLLRAIAAGWKAERTEENAKKMHDAGVELFNRFVKVMELIAEAGASLGKTVEKYNIAIRSIDTRLWPKGEELQRMTGNGRQLGEIPQIDKLPIESSKLKLTVQGEGGSESERESSEQAEGSEQAEMEIVGISK